VPQVMARMLRFNGALPTYPLPLPTPKPHMLARQGYSRGTARRCYATTQGALQWTPRLGCVRLHLTCVFDGRIKPRVQFCFATNPCKPSPWAFDPGHAARVSDEDGVGFEGHLHGGGAATCRAPNEHTARGAWPRAVCSACTSSLFA
jgi:hypothetical protein